MKAVILVCELGTLMREETSTRIKPVVEIGGKPILWHIIKNYSTHCIHDFVIKEYFATYFFNMLGVTFDKENNKMEVNQRYV
jgi:glucose-1-phosphate cytidylyltransferase